MFHRTLSNSLSLKKNAVGTQSGKTILEFAIILPVLFLTIFVFFAAARYLTVRSILNTAANRALSLASVEPGLDTDCLSLPANQQVDCGTKRAAAIAKVLNKARGFTLNTFVADSSTNGSAYLISGSVAEPAVELVISPQSETNVRSYYEMGTSGSPGNTFGSQVDPIPGTSLITYFQQNPIEVRVRGLVDSFVPLFGTMKVEGVAVGFREPVFVSSFPARLDCRGNPVPPGGSGAATCPCGINPTNPLMEDPGTGCVCLGNSVAETNPQGNIVNCICPDPLPGCSGGIGVADGSTCRCECPPGQTETQGVCCPAGSSGSNGMCCPDGTSNQGGICCPAGQINSNGACVCVQTNCAGGTVSTDGSACICDCPDGTTISNGVCCAAGTTNQGGICCPANTINRQGICCPPHLRNVNGSCGCRQQNCAGGTVVDDGDSCDCRCPDPQTLSNGVCCSAGYSGSNGICCPPGQSGSGGICCPTYLQNINGSCGCPNTNCSGGTVVNTGNSCACQCPDGTHISNGLCCPTGQSASGGRCCPTGSSNSGGICCPTGTQNRSGICCPSHLSNINGSCGCPPNNCVNGTTTNTGNSCACTCPPGAVLISRTCTCPNNLVIVNGRCDCPSGYILRNGSCQRPES